MVQEIATFTRFTENEKDDLKCATEFSKIVKNYTQWVINELEEAGLSRPGHWASDTVTGEIGYRPVKKPRTVKQRKVPVCPHCGK